MDEESLIKYTVEMQVAHGVKMQKAKADAYYRDLGDVHWEDLEFYLMNARTLQKKEDFEIAANILAALQKQVLERKPK